MKRIILHPAARAELKEAAAYYRFRGKQLGADFMKEFTAVTDRLRELPFTGSPDVPQRRKALLKRYPYSVMYSVEGEIVHIFAVKHHRREPNYWTDRA